MLRRVLIGCGVVVGVALIVVGYGLFRFLHTDTVKIDDRLYVVLGGGGNTAVLVGDEGVLVVDPKFLQPGRALLRTIGSVGAKPVRVIVNTHYHCDHTHGNINFVPGTRILAQRRVRGRLLQRDGKFWQVEPAWSMLPNDLVDEEMRFSFGDEIVQLIHPGRGHTDGDVVVYFQRRRMLHTGDLFLPDVYPFIDLRAGGSAQQWVGTLDRVLALRDVRQYIPGHGSLSTRADVERFRGYLWTLVSGVEGQLGRGASPDEIAAGIDFSAYDDFHALPFFTSRAKNVRWVYDELSRR